MSAITTTYPMRVIWCYPACVIIVGIGYLYEYVWYDMTSTTDLVVTIGNRQSNNTLKLNIATDGKTLTNVSGGISDTSSEVRVYGCY